MIPTIDELGKEKKQLLEYIQKQIYLGGSFQKQVKLEKFINALKEKVIHEYNIPITVKN